MSNSYKVQDFIKAIPGSGGIISTIAKRVGCSWMTAKKYCTEYPTAFEEYTAECERVLDIAETVIIDKIATDKDEQTAKWYLTMKGRGRGYATTSRNEVTGADGDPLTIEVVYVQENIPAPSRASSGPDGSGAGGAPV